MPAITSTTASGPGGGSSPGGCTRKPGIMGAVNSGHVGGFGKQTAAERAVQFRESTSATRMTATFEYVCPARVEEAKKLGVIA